ncbi:MAG TPA: type II secretion system protein GspE, partial [Allosphingosinicella sp.]
ALVGLEPGSIVHEPRGCAQCGNSGFKGRTGVFEAVRIDDNVRRLINAGGDEVEISAHAFRNSPNLAAAARQLVREGVTSVGEAVRVSRRESEDV